jgi:hypothetical protein
MKVRSILSTLALAGALVSPPVAAGDFTSEDTSRPGDRPVIGNDPAREPEDRKIDSTEIPNGSSIEGLVAAIERDTGRLILDTLEGPISLTAAPEQLDGIEVGDIVRVSLATD